MNAEQKLEFKLGAIGVILMICLFTFAVARDAKRFRALEAEFQGVLDEIQIQSKDLELKASKIPPIITPADKKLRCENPILFVKREDGNFHISRLFDPHDADFGSTNKIILASSSSKLGTVVALWDERRVDRKPGHKPGAEDEILVKCLMLTRQGSGWGIAAVLDISIWQRGSGLRGPGGTKIVNIGGVKDSDRRREIKYWIESGLDRSG